MDKEKGKLDREVWGICSCWGVVNNIYILQSQIITTDTKLASLNQAIVTFGENHVASLNV